MGFEPHDLRVMSPTSTPGCSTPLRKRLIRSNSHKKSFFYEKTQYTRGLGWGVRGSLFLEVLFRELRTVGRFNRLRKIGSSSVSISRPLGTFIVRIWSGLDGSSHKDYVRRLRNSEGEHVDLLSTLDECYHLRARTSLFQ